MWQGWLNLLLGLWLIISGLLTALQGPANMVIVGVLAVFIGFFLVRKWEGVAIGILGIWVLICGFITGFITTHNLLVTGIVISLISMINIFHAHKQHKAIERTT